MSEILCLSLIVLKPDGPGELFHYVHGLDNLAAALADVVDDADLIVTHSMHHVTSIERVFGAIRFDRRKIYNTLTEGQKLYREQKSGLDAWAERLGVRRLPVRGGTDDYSASMGEHCNHDARIVELLYTFLTSESPA